jgi:hypothetical protein
MTGFVAKVFLVLSQVQLLFNGIHGFATPQPMHSRALEASKLLAGKVDEAERLPWDFGRFLQQSSRFVSLPTLFPRALNKVLVSPGDVIWSSGSKSNVFTFSPLDDVVMGGASKSGFDTETGIWKGTVTEANNGGFVGIRSTPFYQPLDMSGCTGLKFKLIGGEGRRFKATVRNSVEFNGVAWTSSFDTKPVPSVAFSAFSQNFLNGGGSGVTTVKIPFEKQIPTIFAKTVPNQVFKKDSIQAIQLTYSKFEYNEGLNPNFKLGDFRLQMVEIAGY